MTATTVAGVEVALVRCRGTGTARGRADFAGAVALRVAGFLATVAFVAGLAFFATVAFLATAARLAGLAFLATAAFFAGLAFFATGAFLETARFVVAVERVAGRRGVVGFVTPTFSVRRSPACTVRSD